MHWIEGTKLIHDRLNRYDEKKYDRKKKKLRENLNINKRNFWFWQRELEKSQLRESFRNNLFKIYLALTKRKYFSLEKSKNLIKSATTG